MQDSHSLDERTKAGLFPNTLWSMVLQAGAEDDAADAALARLCESYRPVVVRFAQQLGLSLADAEDVANDLFHNWLKREGLGQTHPSKGRFRTWVKRGLKNCLADRHRRLDCRPEGSVAIWLDQTMDGEEQRRELPSPSAAVPGDELDREWFLEIVAAAHRQLAADEGHRPDFPHLLPSLLPEAPSPDYAALAPHMGRTEAYLRKRVFVLREKLLDLVIREVAQTCEPHELRQEVGHFFALL
jgi:DNA-directed RNA polymerase specialized sigma24 family protein